MELFGCFNVTSNAIAAIALHCKSLRTMNMGQCWKVSLEKHTIGRMTSRVCFIITRHSCLLNPQVTDSSIAHLAPSLIHAENLDFRGCKQVKLNIAYCCCFKNNYKKMCIVFVDARQHCPSSCTSLSTTAHSSLVQLRCSH